MVQSLWREYEEFCRRRQTALLTRSCDMSDMEWVFPTTLLPLGSFLTRTGIDVVLPRNPGVSDYISMMLTPASIPSDRSKSYIPLVPLPARNADADRVLGLIYRLHDHGRLYGGESAFKYFIGEMVDNVYQHSRFSNSFVMAQRYEKKGFVEVAVVDDGVTIGGSLRGSGVEPFTDLQAIVEILERGISAKGAGERGYGIRTNVRIYTEGLKGAVLIVSGEGAVELAFSESGGRVGQNNYHLQGSRSTLDGTLVSVRIPFPASEVDIHDYTH